MATVAAGKHAPPFELTGTDGSFYRLGEGLRHGPVLVAFFKASCPTCQYAFPFIERIYQQFRPQGGQVWAISQDDARASERFAKEYGVSFPILIDDHPYETSRTYGLKYVPTLFLILPSGQVDLMSDGFARADLIEIQKRLAKHFSVTPPALFLPNERVPEFKPG
jgi:peroxiredoxin